MAQSAGLDMTLLSFDNPVFKSFCFWSAILVLKMLAMSMLTGMQRFRTKTYINEEDLPLLKLNPTFANPEDLPSKKLKVKFDDPDVERVRRAHRNDLENILPFFFTGFLYIMINPASYLAINLFRAVAISRILHTIVYAIVPLPQPSRALAFFVCLGATAYMAVRVILYCSILMIGMWRRVNLKSQ